MVLATDGTMPWIPSPALPAPWAVRTARRARPERSVTPKVLAGYMATARSSLVSTFATGARQHSDNKFFKQHEFDWYGQDTWKVRSNLTLNLGVRYQYNGVPYETS